jgi:hypothetical protein
MYCSNKGLDSYVGWCSWMLNYLGRGGIWMASVFRLSARFWRLMVLLKNNVSLEHNEQPIQVYIWPYISWSGPNILKKRGWLFTLRGDCKISCIFIIKCKKMLSYNSCLKLLPLLSVCGFRGASASKAATLMRRQVLHFLPASQQNCQVYCVVFALLIGQVVFNMFQDTSIKYIFEFEFTIIYL